MNQDERVKYWLDIVADDLDTAECLFAGGRWLYTAFMCHQVIEKVLKAYWAAIRDDDPPYTHSHATTAHMDTPKTLTQDEALALVREYKRVIMPRFNGKAKVYMYGSYSKGYANPWSDIDVAVIVPKIEGGWLEVSTDISLDAIKLNSLIEPVLMQENEPSPLYRDVMRTGIAV